MMAMFRCKQSGNLVSFSAEDDIAAMRKESEYEEVTENAVQIKTQEAPETEEVSFARVVQAVQSKRRGRPPQQAQKLEI